MTVPEAENEAEDRRSLHERIAADLRDEIMSGDLSPGAGLPSTVQLKGRFSASNATGPDDVVARGGPCGVVSPLGPWRSR